jgi:hypothetical protein
MRSWRRSNQNQPEFRQRAERHFSGPGKAANGRKSDPGRGRRGSAGKHSGDQANDLAKQDESAIAANRASTQAALAMNTESVARLRKAMTYSVVGEEDVEFVFSKSDLPPYWPGQA